MEEIRKHGVTDLGKLWKRRDGVFRVPNALNINSLGLLVYRRSEVGGVLALDEFHGNVELLKKDCDANETYVNRDRASPHTLELVIRLRRCCSMSNAQ